MTQTAAQRKAAERGRHKDAGRVAVTVHIYPDDREKLAHYIKRLNDRAERRRSANTPMGAYTWQRNEPFTRKDGGDTTLLIWRFVCSYCGAEREIKATRGGITDRFRCDCRKVHPWLR